jgi:hypothetical protein
MTHQADRFYTIVVIPGEKLYLLFSGGPWHEVTRRHIYQTHIYATLRHWECEECDWIVQDDPSYSWEIPTILREVEIKADM